MRITQLTPALNPFLLALLLQFSARRAWAAATPLLEEPKVQRHIHTVVSNLDQMDDPGGASSDNSCGDFPNCKTGNRVSVLGGGKQMATNIAEKAAHEAEEAYGSQQSAAAEVSQMVKKQLADRADAAANAAKAALAGKLQIVEHQAAGLAEAEAVLQQATESGLDSRNNLHFAFKSAQKAQQLYLAIQNLLKLAQENLETAKAAANGAQREVDDKAKLLESLQLRVEQFKKNIAQSRGELENIKRSAYKAICAAAEARKKAIRERRKRRQIQRHQHKQQQ